MVIGGGEAAGAKARACAAAGAEVTVIATVLDAGLRELATAGCIRHVARPYRPGDLEGALLAYATADDPETVALLREEAERARVLLNVIDTPRASSFIAPAVVSRGELTIAVGTGGASPGLSAALRRRLEGEFGPEYGPFVAILGAVRRALAGEHGRTEVLGALLASPLLDLVRRRDWKAVDGLLGSVGGEALTLARLGVGPEQLG